MDKDRELKIEEDLVQLFNIQGLARGYIFYPDSLVKRITHRKRSFGVVGEIETSMVFAVLNVNLKKNNGFTTNDWRTFYAVLAELIKLCEDEKNEMALKLWGENYHSLSFDQKHIIEDIVGYHIMITFKE